MSDSIYIAHHGIKGMKWGVRRYQNSDGTLTDEGKRHYAKKSVVSNTVAAATVGGYAGGIMGAAVGGSVGSIVGGPAGAIAGTKIGAAVGAGASGIGLGAAVNKAYKRSAYDAIKKKNITKKELYDLVANRQSVGHSYTQNQANIHMQMVNQHITQNAMDMCTRESINSANMCASLSLTGGTNPYIFGVM